MLYSDGTGDQHPDKQLPVYFNNVQMTSFYLDEANGYVYLFVQKDNVDNSTPGLYRIPLATLEAKQEMATIKNDAMLIDNSPILQEGGGDEVTGITQITGDGSHIYWAYISSEGGTALPGMVEYDATNPLHHTGIKMIDAAPADASVPPVITFAVEGIAAYGVAASQGGNTPQPSIPGDVNGDGVVTSVDITALYNYLLNSDDSSLVNGDQDGDGKITAVDVTIIYNIMLGN